MFKNLQEISAKKVIQSIDLAGREETTGIYGIEKEFAFTRSGDLAPCQKIGRHSAFKFIMDYGGIPNSLRCRISPEVFDFMIEVGSEPCFSFRDAVKEITHAEALLWKSLEFTGEEFPGMEEVLLSSGTIYKPADISENHIPEIWGEEKKTYLIEMVKRYKDSLTPQGMHDNLSLPEALLSLQYKTLHGSGKKGHQGFVEFKNEVYVWISRRMRAFAFLLIAIGASSPFDYEMQDGNAFTVLTGYQSNRWLRLPTIESTNFPNILKDYEHFQTKSDQLIENGVIIGANNYMPIRPKGEKRLGEVPLSLEKAAWLHDIMLGEDEIGKDPLLKSLKGKEVEPFITRLQYAEDSGWLAARGLSFRDVIEIWQKSNVRRLLGIPLSRIEIRCQESGGDLEFEMAKTAFTQTLFLYLFSHPDFGSEFTSSGEDLKMAHGNETSASRFGLHAKIKHPFNKKRTTVREFLRHILGRIENFARESGTYDEIKPLYELSRGAKNNAEKVTQKVLDRIGPNPRKTKSGKIIVPEESIHNLLLERKNYVLGKLAMEMGLELTLSPIHRNNSYGE